MSIFHAVILANCMFFGFIASFIFLWIFQIRGGLASLIVLLSMILSTTLLGWQMWMKAKLLPRFPRWKTKNCEHITYIFVDKNKNNEYWRCKNCNQKIIIERKDWQISFIDDNENIEFKFKLVSPKIFGVWKKLPK